MTALKTGDPDVRLAAAVHLEKAAGERQLKDLKEAWNGESDEDVRDQLARTIAATKKRVKAEQAKKAAAAKAASGAGGTTKTTSTGAHKSGAHKTHKAAAPAAGQ